MSGIMPLVRDLGEKLGGEPWIKQPEPFPVVSQVQRIGRADVWPADVLEEIRRFYAECAEEDAR